MHDEQGRRHWRACAIEMLKKFPTSEIFDTHTEYIRSIIVTAFTDTEKAIFHSPVKGARGTEKFGESEKVRKKVDYYLNRVRRLCFPEDYEKMSKEMKEEAFAFSMLHCKMRTSFFN